MYCRTLNWEKRQDSGTQNRRREVKEYGTSYLSSYIIYWIHSPMARKGSHLVYIFFANRFLLSTSKARTRFTSNPFFVNWKGIEPGNKDTKKRQGPSQGGNFKTILNFDCVGAPYSPSPLFWNGVQYIQANVRPAKAFLWGHIFAGSLVVALLTIDKAKVRP